MSQNEGGGVGSVFLRVFFPNPPYFSSIHLYPWSQRDLVQRVLGAVGLVVAQLSQFLAQDLALLDQPLAHSLSSVQNVFTLISPFFSLTLLILSLKTKLSKTKTYYGSFCGFHKGAKLDACVQSSFMPQSRVHAVSNTLNCFSIHVSHCFLSVSLLLECQFHRGRGFFPILFTDVSQIYEKCTRLTVGINEQLLNELLSEFVTYFCFLFSPC